MLKFTTEVKIKGVTGSEIGNFMLNCTDEKYQKWWPNTHLVFNTTMHNPDYAGNKIRRYRLLCGSPDSCRVERQSAAME